MKRISLIMPAKNEVESLNKVLSEITEYEFIDEILVVVDDNNDNSIPIAKKFNCKLIIQNNKGFGSAIIEGFKNASNNYGCIFNADFSFDPKYLSSLIAMTDNSSFIFGSRYKDKIRSGSSDDDFITYIGNKVFSFITKNILRINLTDILYNYVLCDVHKFNSIKFKNNDFRLCIELPVYVKKRNFKYNELPMFERKRFAGKKKVNIFIDGFLIFIEIIRGFKILFFSK